MDVDVNLYCVYFYSPMFARGFLLLWRRWPLRLQQDPSSTRRRSRLFTLSRFTSHRRWRRHLTAVSTRRTSAFLHPTCSSSNSSRLSSSSSNNSARSPRRRHRWAAAITPALGPSSPRPRPPPAPKRVSSAARPQSPRRPPPRAP